MKTLAFLAFFAGGLGFVEPFGTLEQRLGQKEGQTASGVQDGNRTSASDDAGALSLKQLLAQFAKMPGLYAEFREEKRIAFLTQPLINRGRLFYAEGQLLRETQSPKQSRVLIRKNELIFADARKREHLDLSTNPVLRQFVESFVKVLAGDQAGLEKVYRMEFQPMPAKEGESESGLWKLRLFPLHAPMDQVIELIELEGHGLVISSLLVRERSGDESKTLFTKVDPKRRYSPEEKGRIFDPAAFGVSQ